MAEARGERAAPFVGTGLEIEEDRHAAARKERAATGFPGPDLRRSDGEYGSGNPVRLRHEAEVHPRIIDGDERLAKRIAESAAENFKIFPETEYPWKHIAESRYGKFIERDDRRKSRAAHAFTARTADIKSEFPRRAHGTFAEDIPGVFTGAEQDVRPRRIHRLPFDFARDPDGVGAEFPLEPREQIRSVSNLGSVRAENVFMRAFRSDVKHILIKAFGMEMTLGNVLFASSFLATDILSEVYGKKEADKAVWLGIAATIAFIITSLLWQLYVPAGNDVSAKNVLAVFSATP